LAKVAMLVTLTTHVEVWHPDLDWKEL